MRFDSEFKTLSVFLDCRVASRKQHGLEKATGKKDEDLRGKQGKREFSFMQQRYIYVNRSSFREAILGRGVPFMGLEPWGLSLRKAYVGVLDFFLKLGPVGFDNFGNNA